MTPVTGVVNSNTTSDRFLDEAFERGIHLGWIEHRRACRVADCTHDINGQILVGDWKKSWEWRWPSTGKVAPAYAKRDTEEGGTEHARRHQVWEPNTTGPGQGFAAIYNRDTFTIQVAWSRWTKEDCRWCSPCYPGQGDLKSDDGDVVAYTLPLYLLGKGE